MSQKPMSDELLDLLDEWEYLSDTVSGHAYSDSMEDETFSRNAREPFARLLTAVQAVRVLHRPGPRPCRCRECSLTRPHSRRCRECRLAWPCPTTRAIANALLFPQGDAAEGEAQR